MNQPERDASDRRFLLMDAIKLVGVAAIMFSTDRTVLWLNLSFGIKNPWSSPWLPRELRLMTWSLALTGASLVLLLSLLVRPTDRNRLRRGVPGLFVHLAVATVVVVRIFGWLGQGLMDASFQGMPRFYTTRWTSEIMNYLRDDLRREVVVGVAASWLTLVLAGRWKMERAWDDRLGRLLGAFWMIFYLGDRLIDPLLILFAVPLRVP